MSETQLPSHWKIVKLGDVAKIERGKFMHRPRNDPAFYGGDIPFIQTGDVAASNGRITTYSQTLNEKGLSVSKIFLKGTVVITIAANIGYTGILEFDSAFPDSLIGITPNNSNIDVDNEYLNYYLCTQQPEMDRQAPRGTQKNINIQFLAPWRVIIPPLSEQRAIAHTLRTIQKAKEARQRELELERERKAALMQYLFTYGTRNEPTKQTEIGEMPESWQVVKLKEGISQTQYGLSVRGNSVGRYPILRMNNLLRGTVTVDDLQYIDIDLETFYKFKLNQGDLLFNRTKSYELVGKVGLFDREDDFVFASYLIRISVNNDRLLTAYLNAYLNWRVTQQRLKMLASRGVSQSNINATKLSQFLIPLASLSEQNQISDILNASDRKIQALEKEISTLDELLRAMLEELMTGRLSTQPLIAQEN